MHTYATFKTHLQTWLSDDYNYTQSSLSEVMCLFDVTVSVIVAVAPSLLPACMFCLVCAFNVTSVASFPSSNVFVLV